MVSSIDSSSSGENLDNPDNDGDKRPRSEPDLRKYDLAKSKNVSSRDSARNVVPKQRERQLDQTVKGQKLVKARGQYSKYPQDWGKHLQNVETPLQEMRRLMGTLELNQPVPSSSTSQDTAQASSKTKQTQGTLEMNQPVPASSTSQDTAQASSKIKQTQEQSADSN
ncbi:uncharacterized protein LOC126470982 [Schistocerca serialis cubense]|uniref:uncharacterized protein LOC126470982 n=1 Tax=Schistocerca serialis cubense TaxID=2023355 RepID=UPI00214EF68E|nr:uncharacterized protein LOC126470982 [Schistocerca serialis cubense]